MGPKKGLSAFIKSQKKTTSTKDKNAEDQSPATTGEQVKAADAEVKQTQAQNAKNTPAAGNKKAESSDEEEDELELAGQVHHGNIKEQKDVANLNKGKDAEWDMAKLDGENAEESKNAGAKTEKKGFGEGTTFSKPTFGRKAPRGGAKFGGGDFAALDELDDEDSGKGKDSKGKSESKAEENKEEKTGPVKPTFRGRMNLSKTGASGQENENAGVGKTYDFQVHHATPGEKREPREHKQRKPKDKGIDLRAKLAQDAEEDDEFTIVRGKQPKKRPTKKNDDSSSDDDDNQQPKRGGGNIRGARVERGGNRGNRGGFQKGTNNAKKE